MSKVVSILSVVAVVALFLVLGGTLVTVTGLQPQAEPNNASDPGTAFTYQGYLTQSQEPANGSFDLFFSLYDDPEAGVQVGTPLSRTIPITDGLFAVELDFGSVFDGTPLWLEVGVRPAGQTEPFTPLLPRQHLTPVPFSTFATVAAGAPWAGLTGLPAGFADNVDNDRLASLFCAPGQIPEWNGTTWTCGEDDVGTGTGGGDINGVVAGIGLVGGGLTGTVTLNVELSGTGSADTVARSDHNHEGTYSPTGHDHDDRYYTEAELATSGASTVHWNNLSGVPAGLDDGDDDTTYSAGNQITLAGTTFDLVEGAGSGLDADLLDGLDGDHYLTWSNLTGVPAGLDDGDDDTLAGLTCSDGQLPKWDEGGAQWTCAGDLDTTYQPGAGLTLSDTTFALSSTYQLPQICSSGQTVKWNGSAWACGTDELGGGESAWLLTGNAGTSPITNYLGTTDSQALEFRVDGARALRLEPNETSPNLLGGYAGNRVDAGTVGATIGGGGRDLAIHQATGDYSTVDGGAGNTAGGYASAVGGGEGNSAGGSYSTAAGGSGNSASGPYAAVGGGQANTVSGTRATVAGGSFNQANTAFATVGGGYGNVVSGTYATVSGGSENEAMGAHASVGGGSYNRVTAAYGTIGGGGPSDTGNPTTTRNRVLDDYGTVGGGGGNIAGDDEDGPTVQRYATVSGGADNAASHQYATVAGGSANTAGSYAATVGGGVGNTSNSNYATIAGGTANVVTATYGTIGGGRQNKATGSHAVVGGGYGNVVTATFGTIPGGIQNYVGSSYGFAAGRQARAEHTGTFVWSDSSSTPFASTGPDQFLISAAGGVGIGTNAPSHMLTVEGSAVMLSSDLVPVSVVYSHSRTLDAPNAVYAAGDMLYVTSYSTNTLSIWNVSNPEEVVPVGYTTSSLIRPNDLFVSGQRAYVTSESNNRLVVFDVSNPSAPDSLGSTDEGLANPVALYVAGKYAYVASNGPGTMDGLAILDVSDPTQIRLRDFTSTNLLGPSDVFVAGSHAYVTSEANNSLVVFDVSDPRPGQIKVRGIATGPLNSPQAVFVSGPHAYVVADGSDNLVIFDISDPNNIVTAGSTSTNLANPLDVFVAGDLAYVASSGNDRLAVFDVSDPANIVALGFVETGVKPVSLFMTGKQIYVANETGNSVGVYEVTHLEAPTVQTGNLRTAYLDVIDNAAISNDLVVHGGLQVGSSGAQIGGALSVTGQDDSHILGALSVGGAGALISDTVLLTRTLWMTAPTHALDVIGEGRFRVNDYNNLVLRSANAGNDEDAYIDLVRSDQTTVLTPSARIEFDAADPITHTTHIRFYTQGPDDASMSERLRIDAEGDLLPASSGDYSLGSLDLRWAELWLEGEIHQLSDERYKEKISALTYGLEEIRALRPVTFAWRRDPAQESHYGFIAQEVREVLPEVVTGDDGETGTLSMNYGELVPVLVKAVQEQQQEIDTQAQQIADLEARLAALEAGQADQAGRADPPQAVNPLSAFGFGGLVLGAVVLTGLRRKGGRP